jgi:hypothetical protein
MFKYSFTYHIGTVFITFKYYEHIHTYISKYTFKCIDVVTDNLSINYE